MIGSGKARLFKKHVFVLSASVFVLALLTLSGYAISLYFNDVAYLNSLPDKNHYYFLVWRVALYIVLLAVWEPFVLHIFKQYKKTNKQEKVNQLLRYKKKLIIYILLFEVFISQNTITYLMSWVV